MQHQPWLYRGRCENSREKSALKKKNKIEALPFQNGKLQILVDRVVSVDDGKGLPFGEDHDVSFTCCSIMNTLRRPLVLLILNQNFRQET